MRPNEYEAFDAATYRRLQRMADGMTLRKACSKWYKQGQGRAVEQQLVGMFEEQTAGTPLARHVAARFQAICRAAFQRADDDEDEPSLMAACEAALASQGTFDAAEYMQLQRVISACTEGVLDEELSKQEVMEAAERCLHSTRIAKQLTAGWEQ